MLPFKRLFYFLFLLFSTACFAHIHSIFSIEEIDLSDTEHDQILIVFDIDDTLTILGEPAFQRPNFKTHHAEVFPRVMGPLSLKEKTLAFTLPLLTTDGILVEPNSPMKINQIQGHGIKTIGLTAAMGGEIENISIENRRIDELNRVGIDFSDSFMEISERIFLGFKEPIYGKPPIFKEGILFTNENDKGHVLVEFLKLLSWKPKLIVFLDDRVEHLHAVKKALWEYDPNMQYRGLHFQTDPCCYQKVDPDVFEEKWIEMAEKAKEILSQEM